MKQGGLLALTGGSGFIGQRFATLARARGYRIRQLARHESAVFAAGDEYRPLDLEALDSHAPVLDGCDALIHLAAHIPRDHHDPAEAARCWRVNAMGTLHLLEAAARGGVRQVVQTSSANAYAPGRTPPDEETALFPPSRGYYLGSKVLQEIYAAQYGRTAGLMIATVRLGSVYGPGQRSGALAVMARAALGGGPIRIAGDGGFGSDLVWIDDVADALLLVLERETAGPFNVGSGGRTTIAELAEMLADLTHVPIRRDPVSDMEPDWGFPALNIGRLKGLGYNPTPIAAGLRAMLAA